LGTIGARLAPAQFLWPERSATAAFSAGAARVGGRENREASIGNREFFPANRDLFEGTRERIRKNRRGWARTAGGQTRRRSFDSTPGSAAVAVAEARSDGGVRIC